jgi:serine/threonine-protein kinase
VSQNKSPTRSRAQTPQPFGPFVLERRIAIGGSAEVFQARPRQGARPAPQLVIKRLLGQRGQEDHFEALSREAELHRAVRHQNVVTVFGAGMVGTEAYLAMEYVAGVDLHRLLRLAASENRAVPASLAVYITWCIAQALHAVHSAQDASGAALDITHGDVSPSNIYLSSSGEVKLGDFGVAHSTRGATGDREESVRGKFGYLAPEQLSGEAVDQRSDIFSLGVVLGEMLIGQRVFPGEGQLAITLSIREANVEPLRRARERLPRSVFDACTRALARQPSDRFADARAFAESLAGSCCPGEDRELLRDWVAWAADANVHGRQLEQRLRHSSGARRISSERAAVSAGAPPSDASSVRRAGKLVHSEVSFSSLLELAATGQLKLDDEVSVWGDAYRRVEAIEDLARYLMPSTSSTTTQLFEPGVPDFTARLSETPMLEVLARMRMRRESGALFVTRTRRGAPDRKEMYLSLGRLLNLASSDREELLGQYVLHLKLVSRVQLDLARDSLNEFGGKLGDALVGLGLVDRPRVLRAIQNHARDRVAALCDSRDGHAELYRGTESSQLQFPLALDLSVPMMAGAMLTLKQPEDPLAHVARLHPGRRFSEAEHEDERGDAPASLLTLLTLLRPAMPVSEALRQLMAWGKGLERALPEREARAAILVALALEWVRGE